MTNEREPGTMWRRDWSALATLRTSRLRNRTAPAPPSIGRTVRGPTLRLFGAGRNPGPSTATALPRSLPMVLRLRPPARLPSRPLLTLQSQLPAEAMPDSGPPESASSQTATQTTTQPEPVAAAAPERRETPAQTPSLVSRALRIFRRPAPPAPVEAPPTPVEAPPAPPPVETEAAAPGEPVAVRSEAPEPPRAVRQPQQPPAQPPLVLRRAPETSERPEPASQPEHPAQPAHPPQPQHPAQPAQPPRPETGISRQTTPPQPEAALSRIETPQAPAAEAPTPTLVARSETPQTPEAAPRETARPSQPEARAVEPPRRSTSGKDGLLLAVRRIFRPEPAASREEPVQARPEPSNEAQAPGAAAAPIARQAEQATPVLSARPDSMPAERPSVEPPAVWWTVEQPVSEAPLQRVPEASAQPEGGGLLLTLRRFFRASPEPAPEPRPASTLEAPQAAPSMQASAPPTATPRPVDAARRAPDAILPGELPLAPAASQPPVMRAAREEPLTLARPRTVAASETEPERAGAAAIERPEAAPDAPVAQAAPAAIAAIARTQAEAASAPAGRSAEAVRRDAPGLVLPGRTQRPAAGAGLPAVRRLQRQPARSAAPVAAPSLVYLARRPAAATAERAPEGMTTYELPREQLLRMGHRTNGERERAPASTIARAVEIEELEAAVGGEGAGNAAVPGAEAGPEAGAQINLENLARKVYDKIRTRLRIERERSGLSSGAVSR